MADRKKISDELPEKRSERSIPLNVETILFEGARKPKQFTPAEEEEKLKKDGSDLETIRGDLEPPEPVPREIAKGTGKSKNYGKTGKN